MGIFAHYALYMAEFDRLKTAYQGGVGTFPPPSCLSEFAPVVHFSPIEFSGF